MMTFGSLFAGIGGFDLGLERAGMKCLWQVEKDPFCQMVLEKHWPDVKRYEDIFDVTQPESVDLICGGFPCQPFSCAGKQGGKGDDRYLWPEMLRIIREVQPSWVVGENVSGIINMALDEVLSSLEDAGYACQSFIIPACAVDAPHRRDRVWIVAHSESGRQERFVGEQVQNKQKRKSNSSIGEGLLNATERSCAPMAHTHSEGEPERAERIEETGVIADADSKAKPQTGPGARPFRGERIARNNVNCGGGVSKPGVYRRLSKSRLGGMADGHAHWLDEPQNVPRVAEGIPSRTDRLRALGNAVVPQIPEIIGRMIIEHTTIRRQT